VLGPKTHQLNGEIFYTRTGRRANQLRTLGALGILGRSFTEADLELFWVPGAFEIPQAARLVAASGRFDAIVTLGSVIRGGTPHFDYVCRGVTDGLREAMQHSDVPIGFGVLTTDDVDQALARAGGSDGNKGGEVALAAVEMARLLRDLAPAGAAQS